MKAPVIFLGDRIFLSRYGSRYSSLQIFKKARRVVSCSNIGLSSGDWRSASAIYKALPTDQSFRHIYHSRLLVKVREANSPKFFSWREIQRKPSMFYKRPFSFTPDWNQIDEDCRIINRFKPGLVTVGGDWLDILIAQSNSNLIDEVLGELTMRCPGVAGKMILLTFDFKSNVLELVKNYGLSGVAMPINILDIADEGVSKSLSLVKASTKLYGVHCLAGGVIPQRAGIEFALNIVGAESCFIGATKSYQVRELISHGNDFGCAKQ